MSEENKDLFVPGPLYEQRKKILEYSNKLVQNTEKANTLLESIDGTLRTPEEALDKILLQEVKL